MCLGGMTRMDCVWIGYGTRMAEGRAVVLRFRNGMERLRRIPSGIPRSCERFMRVPPAGVFEPR